MTRALSWLVVLALVAGCGSDERKSSSGNVFPNTGGSGGTSGSGGSGGSGGNAGTGAVGGAGGTNTDAGDDVASGGTAGSPDGGQDASPDVSQDGPDPTIECSEDPIPEPGEGYCVSVDGDGYKCNPITSQGCNVAAGERCDYDGERFSCIPEDTASVGPCGLCGDPYPSTCVAGFTCLGLGGKCTRYCCSSLQCALGEVCVMQPPTSVGVCQATRDDIFSGFAGTQIMDAGNPDVEGGVSPNPAECDPPVDPGDGACVTVGSGGFSCNPVTNDGCGPGEACDQDGGDWVCVSGTHDQGICDACTATSCAPGSTCDPTQGCVKYCCTDAECTPGKCAPYPGLGGLGTCRASTVPLGG